MEKIEKEYMNLLFQYLEEICSNDELNKNIESHEKEILEKLEQMEERNPHLKKRLYELSNIIINLISDIKYKYFKFGFLGREISETAVLDWTSKKL